MRVVRCDEATLSRPTAGPPGNDLSLHPCRPGGMNSGFGVGHHGFPANLTRARVQANQVSIGGRVENKVLIDSEILGSRAGSEPFGGQLAPVLPDQVAAAGVKSLDYGSRRNDIHHALINDGYGFRKTGPHPSRPRHAQLTYVAPVDLFQWTESLLIVGSTQHQPVVRTRIQEHFLCYGSKVLYFRHRGRDHAEKDRRNEK